jgi:hypothetical protein
MNEGETEPLYFALDVILIGFTHYREHLLCVRYHKEADHFDSLFPG